MPPVLFFLRIVWTIQSLLSFNIHLRIIYSSLCPSRDELRYGKYTMEYYSAIKNNDFFFPIRTTWMDPESIMLSEINQIEKDRYCMISLISEI